MFKQHSFFGISGAACRGSVFALLTSAACGVFAQTPSANPPQVADLGTGIPDAAMIKEGLFPEDACEELVKSGFKCMGFKPAVTFSLPALAFAVGSAVLPEALKRQLDVFADVLSAKRGSTQKVHVVGHADSSGSDAANTALSKRRADEVKRYLVGKGVDSNLLDAQGVGSRDLIKPDVPTSAENRRVTLGR